MLNKGYNNFQRSHSLIYTLNPLMVVTLFLESHIEGRLFLAMYQRAGSKPLCTSTLWPARCRKGPAKRLSFYCVHLKQQSFPSPFDSLHLSMPVGLYAHHTELCCKSRSSLKGSVKILFFFSPLQTMHTTIA